MGRNGCVSNTAEGEVLGGSRWNDVAGGRAGRAAGREPQIDLCLRGENSAGALFAGNAAGAFRSVSWIDLACVGLHDAL